MEALFEEGVGFWVCFGGVGVRLWGDVICVRCLAGGRRKPSVSRTDPQEQPFLSLGIKSHHFMDRNV